MCYSFIKLFRILFIEHPSYNTYCQRIQAREFFLYNKTFINRPRDIHIILILRVLDRWLLTVSESSYTGCMHPYHYICSIKNHLPVCLFHWCIYNVAFVSIGHISFFVIFGRRYLFILDYISISKKIVILLGYEYIYFYCVLPFNFSILPCKCHSRNFDRDKMTTKEAKMCSKCRMWGKRSYLNFKRMYIELDTTFWQYDFVCDISI